MDSIQATRERLPIFKARCEIIEAVRQNKTSIFVGETGCGKTTQIPQYLLEAGFAKHKCIAVTQPRRVAAITIATRVAEEAKTELGSKVGYSIRFETVTSAATKIKFLTDGMLLRESIGDHLFLEYNVVILDEAHERTLFNDLLLGIVKKAQRIREERKFMPLKIIVMSATLEADHIAKYFNNAPMYTISGRDYSISILYPSKPQENYVHSALLTVFQIHQNEEEGDILVFCTGQEEIEYLVSETKLTALELPAGIGKVHACGLYAALPCDQQTDVFKPVPSGTRKIIFATNIAETSITIPNIKYVVDTGKVKAKFFNPTCGFDALHIQKISKAQAEQRAGRAGREFDGFCYRLYTKGEYEKFRDQTEPEILRCCLSSAALQMIAIGINNVAEFDFIDKPPKENIVASIQMLKILDAVVDNNGKLELTNTGKQMVIFPLDPRFSKMIITSTKYNCTDEILTIISLLSVESVFYTKISEREKFNEVKKKFETVEGDHIMLLNIYKQYKKFKGNTGWCRDNYINSRNMKKAIAIRKQLNQLCGKIGISHCSSSCTIKIRKCLASGLFMNVALLHEKNTYRLVEGNQEIKIHPSSSLFKTKNLSCVIYTELVQTSSIYMRNVTYIPEEMLLSAVPKYFKDKPCRLSTMKPISYVSDFH
ncbi:ATP-dependent RNA helicase DHX33 [Trichonephila inaurata madagascariensis]|uniref:RNA helicase n=1 Tax=Trichonephila inaurata madagascariensis TaxID=2747483 RepID=A0A8X7CJ12_9ARAC|nr:ATP-dependent RNA helicase DHX33 [Trichonephila inaurata madagascariensis]